VKLHVAVHSCFLTAAIAAGQQTDLDIAGVAKTAREVMLRARENTHASQSRGQ
jgi:hypothetical protein